METLNFVLKVFSASLFLSLIIKYGVPYLEPIPASTTGLVIVVCLPSVILGTILGLNALRS